jgi:hypothetical protein
MSDLMSVRLRLAGVRVLEVVVDTVERRPGTRNLDSSVTGDAARAQHPEP